MANFHLEIRNIVRSTGPSLTGTASYTYGRTLYDSYTGKKRTYNRDDVLYCHIFLPKGTPIEFNDLQYLCDKMEEAEKRSDARTARYFIGSLPNELPKYELSRIVREFCEANFCAYNLCAIAAVHEGRNEDDPSKNNPHAHIIVSTRTVGPDGFNKKKDREHNQRKYITIWRSQWSQVQNRAYKRNGLDIRVSHEQIEVQGKQREALPHLSRIDWQKERQGERTRAGDERRCVERRNQERNQQRSLSLDLK